MNTVFKQSELQLSLIPLKVVFTGAAMNPDGSPVIRAALKAACEAKGIVVQASVQSTTDMLVASRTDTVKAHTAALKGLRVLDYPTFIKEFIEAPIDSVGYGMDYKVDTNPVHKGPKPGIVYGDEL